MLDLVVAVVLRQFPEAGLDRLNRRDLNGRRRGAVGSIRKRSLGLKSTMLSTEALQSHLSA